jgi:hypothetical protein
MEVKGILEKIRQPKEEKKEGFFALEIGLGFVKSAIWLVEDGKIRVLCLGANQKWSREEDLIKAVDASLSAAAESLAEQSSVKEPNRVIFGLPDNWVSQDKILPENLTILKKISEALDLKPVGFVITVEAVAHYLKVTEGVPPTAILAILSADKLSLALIRLGKASLSQEVKRSPDLAEDMAEGLSRYEETEAFPARVLLINANGQEELEKARQQLVDYPWQEKGTKERKIVFLHLPKVEIISNNLDIRAVALAGGREVAKAAGVAVDYFEKKAKKPTKKKPLPSQAVADKDEKKTVSAEPDFGFIKEKDIFKVEKPASKVQAKPETPQAAQEAPGPELAEKEDRPSLSPVALKKEKGPGRVKFSWPSFHFSWLKQGGRKILSFFNFAAGLKKRSYLVLGLVGLFLLLLFGGGFAAYWYLPKASVILQVEPRVLEEKFEVKLDPTLKVPDKENLILPAKKVEIDVDGQKTSGSTGTKLIGEEAKGEVVVFNGTSQKKTFEAGTTLASSTGVEFSFDEVVEVASQSGTAADPVPGKVTAKVTAVAIGSESNLAAETEFLVANYSQSDYLARNESAFSGGTSREVQVVTQDDQEKLLAALTQDLETKSAEKLKNELSSGESLIQESIKSTEVEKKFSQDVEEESEVLGLDLKLKTTGLIYGETELRQLIQEAIKDKVPDNFEFRSEASQLAFELQEVTDQGVAIFTVKLSASLLPEMDLAKIRRDLVGKYPQIGKTYLDNLANVVGAQIELSPGLPERILTFPRVADNIDIQVEVKR